MKTIFFYSLSLTLPVSFLLLTCISFLKPGTCRVSFFQDFEAFDKATDEGPLLTSKDSIDVKMFGVKGDGVTDDTDSLQKVMDYAAKMKYGIYIPSGGTYIVSSIRIRNGLKRFVCDGVIKGRGISSVGVITLDGPYLFKGIAVSHCYIRTSIDMSNGDIFGIHADGCIRCVFENNNIYGFTNSKTNKYGLLLEQSSAYNKIIGNKITGYEQPVASCVLIGLFGKTEAYAGFFNNGKITAPIEPCTGNIIKNNQLYLGRYAIDLLGGVQNVVSNNYCYKNHHRAIYLANATAQTRIYNNRCIGYGSSGVVIGYGSNNNKVFNNVMKQIKGYNPPGAEAAVNVTSGSYQNIISHNSIESFTNYGIYFAVNVVKNVADGNRISGYYLSAIAIENDLQQKNSSDSAIFSRPNYAPPLIGTKWASRDTEGNRVENNIIGNGYPGRNVTGIYVSQRGTATLTKNNIIKNNTFTLQTGKTKPIYFFDEKGNALINNKVSDNKILHAKKPISQQELLQQKNISRKPS